ncbi:MAG: paraquat-inducible protein A [Desulfobulbus sp.]|nr:paraquat-inducible protein A [Desulfobulbus sp.]
MSRKPAQHPVLSSSPSPDNREPSRQQNDGVVTSETDRLIACHDCDLLHHLPDNRTTTLLCARCGAVLRRRKPATVERSLAWITAALILFILSNSFPFLAIQSSGLVQETILLSGIHELWKQGLHGLSVLVLLTCVLVPLVQMLGLLYILTPLQFGRTPAPYAGSLYRFIQELAPWGMMEVFMVGILVALVKLGHLATIIPGISVFSFAALIFVMAAAFASLDPVLLWDHLDLRR